MFEMLEFGCRGGKQLLDNLHMGIHRPAHIEEEQNLDRVAPLWPGLDIQIAMFGGGANGAIEVQLVGGAVAGPAAQALKRHFDVAGA